MAGKTGKQEVFDNADLMKDCGVPEKRSRRRKEKEYLCEVEDPTREWKDAKKRVKHKRCTEL